MTTPPSLTPPTDTFASRIETCLANRDWPALKQLAERLEPSEVATLFDELGPPEYTLLYRSLPRDLAADAFSFLEDDKQQDLLRELTEQETRTLLADLSPDDRTFLFEELPANTAQRLLNLLGAEDRKESLMLLGYPKDSVGRLMSPDFATIRPEMTVAEAIDAIRQQAPQSETIHMVYVTDAHDRLIDELRLRRLILEPPDRRVAELLGGDPVSLNAFDPEGAAVTAMKETGYFALPVVDSQGILIGVVTADDVLELAVEEATEDIHKGAAVRPFETPFLETPSRSMFSGRVAWLMPLVGVNIISGWAIHHYEEMIQAYFALAFFLPLLIASGGNAGAQSATLVVRSMALGDVRPTDYLRVLVKDVGVALMLAASLAAAVFLLGLWRAGGGVALVVAISMAIIVVFGSVLGMSLPFILRRLGLDPATASSPLVTSMADIVGVFIYLGIASIILGSLAS